MTPSADTPLPMAAPPCGPVSGTWEGPVAVFRGIPYASAERFARPQPIDPWSEPLDAGRHRSQCPQLPSALDRLLGDPDVPTAESCHHLEVYTPAVGHGTRPVVVWIHGGAFVTGGAAMPWYHGGSLAQRGDLVVVTINYRLGALGFAGSTNAGLHDQVAALQWVRDNIAAFGGDPSAVTVMGESAGGASVVALMAAPTARDLFCGAIAMSPSIGQLRSRRRADEALAQLLDAARVADLDELARIDLDRLLAAQAVLLADPAGAITAFAPTPDDELLPGPVVAAAAADDRPLVIGTTRDEMLLFTAFDPANAMVDARALRSRFSAVFADRADEAIRRYRAARPGATPGQLVSALQTDEAFRVPARTLADRRSASGRPTWMYWFTYSTPAFGGLLGSCHGLDIPFAFHNLRRPGVEMFTGAGADREGVADEFAGAVISLAREGRPRWPRYDVIERPTRRIDVVSTTIRDPEPELCELWHRRG